MTVRGARQHNLQGVDVQIPRDRMTVITGPSGSGKSSLAFDTVYAEGQRRYVESLSVQARRVLERLPRPDVDLVEGLSPTIAIQPRPLGKNPRSTVGTVTEIYDYLRLLFAKVGRVGCPDCGRELRAMTVPQMVDKVLAWPPGTRFRVLAPRGRVASPDLAAEFDALRRDGWVRVELDGRAHDSSEPPPSGVSEPSLDVVVDRLSNKDGVRRRLAEAIEHACRLSGGVVRFVARDGGAPLELTDHFRCSDHGRTLDSLSPSSFSFNSREGACHACKGLGEERVVDPDRVVPDPSLSLNQGAIAPWGGAGTDSFRARAKELRRFSRVKLDTPWRRIPKATRARILFGAASENAKGVGGWPGVIPAMQSRFEAYARGEGAAADELLAALEDELARFTHRVPCRSCEGKRLRAESLAVRVGGADMASLGAMPLTSLEGWLTRIELAHEQAEIASRLLEEVRSRVAFLVEVGLGYLALDRPVATLSAGEAQRIRLGTQLGAALVGVLYVLDEPSIGLHPRDRARLLAMLRRLVDVGNTVLLVEHDPQAILAADHVIEMGPGAGRHGGRVVSEGSPVEIEANPDSPTGRYLAGLGRSAEPQHRRRGRHWLTVRGASVNNLKAVTASFPLETLVCVTGVSGSGKSSLVMETLLPRARRALHQAAPSSRDGELEGMERLDRIVAVDQAPIGRSPRSNPATYCGVLGPVRELFAALPEARARGWEARRFSYNVKGGRCEACQGEGALRVAMHFLPDVFVQCEQCSGRRYDRETLEVRYHGASIADVLDLTVDEAFERLAVVPKLRDRLGAMRSVGLGYLTLGQSALTLSAGEAQRLKLAKELARRSTGATLYVLDEPTSGLAASDVRVLMDALEALVEQGNSVVVIEHDLDVVLRSDHVVDLGPDGGDGGGEIVFAGTPEDLVRHPASATGRCLHSLTAERGARA